MAIEPNVALGVQVPKPPDALGMVGQFMGLQNAQIQNKLLNIQTQNQAQQGAASRNAVIAQNALGVLDLLRQNPNNPRVAVDALHQRLDFLAGNGVITPQEADTFHALTLKTTTPQELAGLLERTARSALGMQEQYGQTFGTGASVNQGDTILQGVAAPARMGGGFNPTTATPTTLTPGEKVAPQTTVGPNNQPGNVPTGTRFDRFGNPIPAAPAAAPGVAPAAPPAFNPTGPEPDYDMNLKAYQAAQAEAPNARQRVANLNEALKALRAVQTGKGSNAFFSAIAPFVTAGIIPAEAASDYAKAKKYLLDYAARMGGRSDAALSSAIEANANTDIPNPAAIDIVRTNIGQERMANLLPAISAPDTSGKGFLKHQQDINTLDRRAFALDLYSPEEIKKITSSFKTDEERAKFNRSLGLAVRHKLVTLP